VNSLVGTTTNDPRLLLPSDSTPFCPGHNLMPAHNDLFINQELSWLEFNQRVLDESADTGHPLLERLKFLAITASNLDEFFMVRVGGLQMVDRQGHGSPDAVGLTPGRQLELINLRVRQMIADQYARFSNELEPVLAVEGIRRVSLDSIDPMQETILSQVVDDEIYSVLTPMAVSADAECPLLPGGSLCVSVRLDDHPDGSPRFAWIPCGHAVPRLLTLPSDGGYAYMLLEDVIARSIDKFFPDEHVLECVPFRITRNADLSLREDEASDLMEGMQEILEARKESHCVRLEIAEAAEQVTREFLMRQFEVDDDDVYPIPGPLDLSAFFPLTDLPGFNPLKDTPWPPVASPVIDSRQNLFDVLAEQSVLLCHPFESFDPVVRFVEEAAADPDVLAIKQILYRTSRDSPIVGALARAAELGKHVTVIVELKARFDEARNIEWARSLEQAGVQVIYGIRGLKTHAKVCLVVRRQPGGIRRYVHFGTGNYNESTSRLYTDISYLTVDNQLGADAATFFNTITGYTQPRRFELLEAAPLGLRDRLLELIAAETERKRQGQPARILAKMNSLVDPKLIQALYDASAAGVEIRLNVRGICCLRPEVPGLSEHITVTSIVDRFLEHSRVFHFHQGGQGRTFISSADWMPRNLDRRIELMVPIDDPDAAARLLGMLEHCLADRVKGRRLRDDGSYDVPVDCARFVDGRDQLADDGSLGGRSQQLLYDQACRDIRISKDSHRDGFVPHRAPGHKTTET